MAGMNMSSMLGMTPEQMDIARKQRYAEALRGQSEQPTEGQMVSGHYVPPNWTQHLAKMLSAYGAGKMERESDDMQKQFAGKQQAELEQVANALRGTPEQKTQFQADNPFGEDLGNLQTVTPAQPGDRNAALAMALKSSNPALQQFAIQESFKNPDAIEYSTTPQYDQQGNAFVVSKTGGVKYLDGVQARDKVEFVNDVAVNPYETKPGTAINDYNKPFLADGSPNPAYQSYETNRARAGATQIGMPAITVNTEKSYAGNVAEGLAKTDVAVIDAARKAPQRIASAQEVMRILTTGKPITGTAAEQRLVINKALSTAGLVDGKNVKDTESLASQLASQTLDAIASSGLGSGQGFTDKDRAFLERAKSGNIEMNANTLMWLAQKNEQAARGAIEQGNKVAKRLRGNPAFGSVGQDLEIEMPAPFITQQPSGNWTIRRK